MSRKERVGFMPSNSYSVLVTSPVAICIPNLQGDASDFRFEKQSVLKNSFPGIMVSIFVLHEQDMFEIHLGYFQGSSRDFCGISVSVYEAEFAN